MTESSAEEMIECTITHGGRKRKSKTETDGPAKQVAKERERTAKKN